MKSFLRIVQQQIRFAVQRGWRRLLRLKRGGRQDPVRLGHKSTRSRHCGRIGLRTNYVIHASPPPPPGEQLEQSVRELLKASEERFFAGRHFAPFAEQVDVNSAVITSRMRQGADEQVVDHLVAIFPDPE